MNKDYLKKQAAHRAVSYVKSGMIVGLGTGSTSLFALQRIADFPQIREIVTTDTVPRNDADKPENMVILSTAPVFGGAIRQNYYRRSIGELFDFGHGVDDE